MPYEYALVRSNTADCLFWLPVCWDPPIASQARSLIISFGCSSLHYYYFENSHFDLSKIRSVVFVLHLQLVFVDRGRLYNLWSDCNRRRKDVYASEWLVVPLGEGTPHLQP